MMGQLKNILYFPIASYFRFFAIIKLRRWKPRIVVVTGSSGKTTLLHMLQAQLGEGVIYSHHANSSYGIPFFILDLHRKSFKTSEWVSLLMSAPVNAFKKVPKEKIFVVEADTDRAGEGKFLAELLKPEVVFWTSVSRTHAMNFESLVKLRDPSASVWMTFKTVDEAIAYDYGYFVEFCQKLVVMNGDSDLQKQQLKRTNVQTKEIMKADALKNYEIKQDKTVFHLKNYSVSFDQLMPEEIVYSIEMCREVCEYFKLPFDRGFVNLQLPPGRSSLFKGINDTTLIDSSYNANLSSMIAVLKMFEKIKSLKKWVVLGDMMELGEKEQEEHEKLGEVLNDMNLDRVILVGERVGKYTFPILEQKSKIKNQNHSSKIKSESKFTKEMVLSYSKQNDAFRYLLENLKGGEMILFKGSQSMMLEGMIEFLLADKKDSGELPRRGSFWDERRKKIYS